jgi:hypothetical protein
VAILGTVVHGEENGRRRQALHEPVEHALGLGIDPLQVLEDHQQRLDATLAHKQALDRVERASATLAARPLS